jgi:hypothetical protein
MMVYYLWSFGEQLSRDCLQMFQDYVLHNLHRSSVVESGFAVLFLATQEMR